MHSATFRRYTLSIAAFCAVFVLVPLRQLHFLANLPGDIGDGRLNNYFLENVYRFVTGSSPSLWQLSFYVPFPDVIGFSDNLFGSSPIYVVARLLSAGPSTAFQIWFLVGYVVNFAAALYALRRCALSITASTVGALIFTFALPTTAHVGHVQLHYRFGVPLAIVFFWEFLSKYSWRSLVIAAGWTVWQMYAGVYIGNFILISLAVMTAVHLTRLGIERRRTGTHIGIVHAWRARTHRGTMLVLGALAGCVVLMGLLFAPYIRMQHEYGFARSWMEISSMTPRPQSYVFSNISAIWSPHRWESSSFVRERFFRNLPNWREHQMFIGLVPLVLAIIGIVRSRRRSSDRLGTLMAWTLVILVALSIQIKGVSAWSLVSHLPLMSSMRAVSRLILVLLFPVAYLAARAVEGLWHVHTRMTRVAFGAIAVAMVVEMAWVTMPTSAVSTWEQRLATMDRRVPEHLPANSIVFIAPPLDASKRDMTYGHELDVMWVALERGVSTMNGYSGFTPPGLGYAMYYGNDCRVVPMRVLSYLKFRDRFEDRRAYRTLMEHIVPIGFVNCDPQWLLEPPEYLPPPEAQPAPDQE